MKRTPSMSSGSNEPSPTARRFRRLALESIDPNVQPMPPKPSVAFVWPTELCGIGCAHCSFGSVRSGNLGKRELADFPESLVEWLIIAGARKLVACGGGEPLDEPDFWERAIAACAKAALPFEIYTGGISSHAPRSVSDYLSRWTAAWTQGATPRRPIRVRLSVDRFHEERIGLEPVVEWVRKIEEVTPEWVVAFRSLRLENDDSVERLTQLLRGELVRNSERSGRITLPNGRTIIVEWKGFVFERRGRLPVLARRGLNLTSADAAVIHELEESHGSTIDWGRPLSAPLTVSHNVMDLEIHADCVVHILESQAPDLRYKFTAHSWAEMRNHYFRDPILHRIVESGLPAIAEMISDAKRAGIGGVRSVPYSVERIEDEALLDWLTAQAIVRNSRKFVYPEDLRTKAQRYVSDI